MVSKSDLFEDVAVALDYWQAAATESITNPSADLLWVDIVEPYEKMQVALAQGGVEAAAVKQVFGECLRGFAVAMFTALDGGYASAEKGRVYLVDEEGRRLGEGLHEAFVSYLLKSGRLS